jgi:phosphoribosylformylglycinamidine synthase
MGVEGIRGVRVGKLIELDIDAPDADAARAKLAKAADELLANPVIEDYEVVV